MVDYRFAQENIYKTNTKPSSANHFQDNDEVKTNRLAE